MVHKVSRIWEWVRDLVLVNVDLDEDAIRVLIRQFDERRTDALARAAPCGREVNAHQLRGTGISMSTPLHHSLVHNASRLTTQVRRMLCATIPSRCTLPPASARMESNSAFVGTCLTIANQTLLRQSRAITVAEAQRRTLVLFIRSY